MTKTLEERKAIANGWLKSAKAITDKYGVNAPTGDDDLNFQEDTWHLIHDCGDVLTELLAPMPTDDEVEYKYSYERHTRGWEIIRQEQGMSRSIAVIERLNGKEEYAKDIVKALNQQSNPKDKPNVVGGKL